jgi:sugar phosphate isomerase/epimerase
MNHVLSTHMFVQHRLTAVWLDRIWDAGVPSVELFCARQHLDYRDRGQVVELGHWFRDAELKCHSIHAPFFSDTQWGRSGPQSIINITETTKAKRIAMTDEIKRAIEIAEYIPFRYMVQHLGTATEEYDERKLDAAFSALEELSLFAKQRGVEILLENIPNRLSSAMRLMAFIEMTHLNLNFCFDTGHANIMETVEGEFNIMKDRIRSTHIHDNDGKEDKHLFPFFSEGGNIDWRQTMELMGSRPNQYALLLELKEQPEIEKPFEYVRQIFDKFESLAVPEPVR